MVGIICFWAYFWIFFQLLIYLFQLLPKHCLFVLFVIHPLKNMYCIIIATLAVSVLGDGIYHVKNTIPANVIFTAPAPKHSNKAKHVSIQIVNKGSSMSKAFKDVTLNIVEDKNRNKLGSTIFDDGTGKKVPSTQPITILGSVFGESPSPSPSPSPVTTPTAAPSPNRKEKSPQFNPVVRNEDDNIDEAAAGSLPSSVDVECLSIADTIMQNPKLSIFQSAIEATRLTQFLSNTSLQVTLFAPSDTAMKKLAKSLDMSIQKVLSNPALASVVGYHLIPGAAILASELKSDEKLLTSLKQNITVGLPPNGDITLTGFEATNIAKIINSDISACKSVMHIIDTVLLPDESVDENQQIIY
eukprot:TRINITY_DN208_c0_g1_i6.p1 TRINITY_DN208_c0_g1~~TRINITY_DN208_c0_g1_i6.p1  ORF type:complete len:357 (-),score=45.84 TRINITY_DN208_c0_g1_i6:370-1440(-)